MASPASTVVACEGIKSRVPHASAVSAALGRVVVWSEVKEEGRYSGPGDMSGTQQPGAVLTRPPLATGFLGKPTKAIGYQPYFLRRLVPNFSAKVRFQ